MNQTRREFIATSAVTVIALSSGGQAPSPVLSPESGQAGAPVLHLQGDPYLAFVDDGGLGGRTWDEAREHAMRFRSTPEERDRYVLGLEI
jgi:hypothetical protein